MSYEFNPESQIFEFPNPYKVENLSLMVSGSIVLLAGLIGMISVREQLAHNPDEHVFAVIGISVALLLLSIGLFARAFSQLRYFFGRNRPDSLAPPLENNKSGDTPDANFYKETLRQNAISFREPKGALNGLLYSWLPNLIFAPIVVQRTAQTLFHNFLSLTVTCISFLLCWLMFGQGESSAWIGLVYAAFAAPQVLRPMMKQPGKNSGSVTETAQVGSGGLVVLIVLAVLGPVILALAAPHLPNLGQLSINTALAVALICALIGCIVFGAALRNQLHPAPQIVGSARETDTVTMNAHPNKLIEELDRILMEKWYSRIPNRKYTRRLPIVEGQQGQFTAEIFEETQPRPQSNRAVTGIGHALSTPRFRWLTLLTGLAFVYLCMGAFAALLMERNILAGEPSSMTAAYALSLIAVSLFCYRAAHILWGRFDFISELIWVEINGSFESGRVNIGNQISSNVQTTKNVINIESMTMRVWVSEIDTVIFGKDAPRQLIGMRGLPDMAKEYATLLKQFGEARSMVIAPTTAQDFDRAHRISLLDQAVREPDKKLPPPEKIALLVGAAAQNEDIADNAPRWCMYCGTKLDAGASFCGECGKPIKS
ncbi:MAG: zinc ribbon domain-containing protein [Methylobacillus sp.]|jgi:hypothetical protein|nr:zinc ribbon domain-containing protein [Methylobacillus sp.]